VTLAIVASLETLLSIEAIDRIDPFKRVTPTNRELMAQGVGNMASGLLGGIPVTSVIVRSSANMSSGARTKMSTILHGLLLLLCVYYDTAIAEPYPAGSTGGRADRGWLQAGQAENLLRQSTKKACAT
jgi:MFS superfamily sulfate permease-like transporter